MKPAERMQKFPVDTQRSVPAPVKKKLKVQAYHELKNLVISIIELLLTLK